MAKDVAKGVTKMSMEELEAKRDELAKQRTAVREEQVAVQAEIDLRIAMQSMPDSARRVVLERMGGTVESEGGTN
jgi:hypothetical protein